MKNYIRQSGAIISCLGLHYVVIAAVNDTDLKPKNSVSQTTSAAEQKSSRESREGDDINAGNREKESQQKKSIETSRVQLPRIPTGRDAAFER
jgi:hypothetical protein